MDSPLWLPYHSSISYRVLGTLALDQTSVEEVVQAAAQGIADARGCTEPRMPFEELCPRFLEAPDVGRSAVSDDG